MTAPGTRNEHGEYVQGDPTDYDVWASRRDTYATDKIESGRSLDETARTWRVRWRPEIANANTRFITIDDGSQNRFGLPLVFRCDNLVEVTGNRYEIRRRWLDIEGTSIVT